MNLGTLTLDELKFLHYCLTHRKEDPISDVDPDQLVIYLTLMLDSTAHIDFDSILMIAEVN